MDAKSRREEILKIIEESEKPISASNLAKKFSISRQIIVGDVALLRACGYLIVATPRGYIMEKGNNGIVKTIAVSHNKEDMMDEIYTIVDMGGELIDVIVDHPVYGQLSAMLQISSRYDADEFYKKISSHEAIPLCHLTNGLHLHTIRCKNEESFDRVIEALDRKGYLYKKI